MAKPFQVKLLQSYTTTLNSMPCANKPSQHMWLSLWPLARLSHICWSGSWPLAHFQVLQHSGNTGKSCSEFKACQHKITTAKFEKKKYREHCNKKVLVSVNWLAQYYTEEAGSISTLWESKHQGQTRYTRILDCKVVCKPFVDYYSTGHRLNFEYFLFTQFSSKKWEVRNWNSGWISEIE